MSEHSTDPVVQGQVVADEKLREATGRTRQEWHRILVEAGAGDWSHATIAKWLTSDHGVAGWWAQGITVGFEHERGTRQPGQQADGSFAVSATKTVRAPKAAALQAVVESVSADLGEPVSTSPDVKFATARWLDGPARVLASVSQPKPDRVLMALETSRLAEPATAESKARLRGWLEAAADSLY